MPPILSNIIVILILAVIIFLAVRSIWRNRRKGGCGYGCAGCTGNCISCPGAIESQKKDGE